MSTTTTRSPRPTRYRKPGLWMTALRRLHAKRFSDRQIAETLNDLSDEAIRLLEEVEWYQENIDALSEPMAGSSVWTPRAVRHYRSELGLKARQRTRYSGDSSIALIRRMQYRDYQRAAGWATITHELTPQQCDVLTLLKRQGSLTRPQILQGIGITGNRFRRNFGRNVRDALWHLRSLGLIERSPDSFAPPHRYGLTPLSWEAVKEEQWR